MSSVVEYKILPSIDLEPWRVIKLFDLKTIMPGFVVDIHWLRASLNMALHLKYVNKVEPTPSFVFSRLKHKKSWRHAKGQLGEVKAF